MKNNEFEVKKVLTIEEILQLNTENHLNFNINNGKLYCEVPDMD